MLVKMIRTIRVNNGPVIKTGEVLKVRFLPDGSLLNINRPFQVIEGEFSGHVIGQDACVKVEEEKLYTEKEFNDLKEHYLDKLKNEQEKTELFKDITRDLAGVILDKNKEIEKLTFFLESTNIALKASCKAINQMHKQQKVH